mgnify:CR=1 FL=1
MGAFVDRRRRRTGDQKDLRPETFRRHLGLSLCLGAPSFPTRLLVRTCATLIVLLHLLKCVGVRLLTRFASRTRVSMSARLAHRSRDLWSSVRATHSGSGLSARRIRLRVDSLNINKSGAGCAGGHPHAPVGRQSPVPGERPAPTRGTSHRHQSSPSILVGNQILIFYSHRKAVGPRGSARRPRLRATGASVTLTKVSRDCGWQLGLTFWLQASYRGIRSTWFMLDYAGSDLQVPFFSFCRNSCQIQDYEIPALFRVRGAFSESEHQR